MSMARTKASIAVCLATSIFSAQVVTPALAQGSDLPDIIPPGYPGAGIPLLNPIPIPGIDNPERDSGPTPLVPVFPKPLPGRGAPKPTEGINPPDLIDLQFLINVPKIPPAPDIKFKTEGSLVNPPDETSNNQQSEEQEPFWNPPVESTDLIIDPPALTLDVPEYIATDTANQLDFLASIGLPREQGMLGFLQSACMAVGSSSLAGCASNSTTYSDEEKAQLAGAMMLLIWSIAERDPATWTDEERLLINHIEERIWKQQIEYADRAAKAWEKFVDDHAKEVGSRPGFGKLLDVGPDATLFEPPSLYDWTDDQTSAISKTVQSIELAGGMGGLAAGLAAGAAVGGGLAAGIAAAMAAQVALAAAVASTAGSAAVGSAATSGAALLTSVTAGSGAASAAAGPAVVIVVAVLALAIASAKVDGARKMEKALGQAVIDARNTRPSMHELATSTDQDISTGLMLALYDLMIARPGYTSPDGQIKFLD